MSGIEKDSPTEGCKSRREELLERIWEAQAEKLALILEQTPPDKLQAATLNVARQFLGDNGVSIESLSKPDQLGAALQRTAIKLQQLKAEELRAPLEGTPEGELPVPQWDDERLPKGELK